METASLIPTEFMPIINSGDTGNNDPRRVTLLHKKGDVYICALSRGMEEVEFGKPIDDAFVLNMYGEKSVSLVYNPQLTFYQRPVRDSSYMLVKTLNPLSDKMKKSKIPFTRKQHLLSDFAGSGETLDDKVSDFITSSNDIIVALFESIADVGVLRAKYTRNFKEKNNLHTEIGKSLYHQIAGLFHEEEDGSPVKKRDLNIADWHLKDFTSDPRPFSTKLKNKALIYGLSIPLMSLIPPSIIDFGENALREKYEKRMDQIQEDSEKAAVAFSQFCLCNPKLIAGIKRGFFEIKAASNIGIYGLQLAANGYAIHNWSPWIAVPLTIPTLVTGATMLRNAVHSGGQDFSGVIPTLFNKALIHQMENRANYKKPKYP